MKFTVRVSLILLFASSIPFQVRANDRRFSYVYETSVLSPGLREIETWNTYRTGRHYYFRQIDQRVEYEFGVSKNLMSALYLNYSSAVQDSNGVSTGGTLASTFSLGFSNEWKLKIFDRVADPIGLGFYGEFTLNPKDVELEGKILLDKEMGNFLFAFNGVGEHEWETEFENGEISTKRELTAEFNLGISYAFDHSFSAGIEFRNINEFDSGELEHSPIFAGPVFSYSAEGWWVTATVLPQITSFAGATDGRLVLEDHEKVEARLLLSFHL